MHALLCAIGNLGLTQQINPTARMFIHKQGGRDPSAIDAKNLSREIPYAFAMQEGVFPDRPLPRCTTIMPLYIAIIPYIRRRHELDRAPYRRDIKIQASGDRLIQMPAQ
jgi:hypothetical protein